MTSSPAQPGSECAECRAKGVFVEARRSIASDDGKRINLCLNHAATRIHAAGIYDQTMNPTGKR